MFSRPSYESMYKRFLGPLAQQVGLKLNNGTDFDAPILVDAHVSKYREDDLVSGGSIELGDLRLIILESSIPDGLRRLEMKDRIEIEGRNYSVIHWDTNTRTIGDSTVAVEVTVRG